MSKNREYADAVARGAFPSDPAVPLDDRFVDERGEILNVLFTDVKSIARLGSKRGSVRANHVHSTDWHYALVEFGKVLYFERDVGSKEVPEPRVFGAGEMFFTPPGREHAMLFAEDSVIYTFAKNTRTHENHEADLARVDFITPALAEKFFSQV